MFIQNSSSRAYGRITAQYERGKQNELADIVTKTSGRESPHEYVFEYIN